MNASLLRNRLSVPPVRRSSDRWGCPSNGTARLGHHLLSVPRRKPVAATQSRPAAERTQRRCAFRPDRALCAAWIVLPFSALPRNTPRSCARNLPRSRRGCLLRVPRQGVTKPTRALKARYLRKERAVRPTWGRLRALAKPRQQECKRGMVPSEAAATIATSRSSTRLPTPQRSDGQ